jgi:hypothetical protein
VISEARLEKALFFLSTTDEESADLKGHVARSEYLCKMARAKVFLVSEGSVEARKAISEVSEEVQLAEDKLADAIVAYEKLRSKRATEVLITDVWRSLNSARTKGVIL